MPREIDYEGMIGWELIELMNGKKKRKEVLSEIMSIINEAEQAEMEACALDLETSADIWEKSSVSGKFIEGEINAYREGAKKIRKRGE